MEKTSDLYPPGDSNILPKEGGDVPEVLSEVEGDLLPRNPSWVRDKSTGPSKRKRDLEEREGSDTSHIVQHSTSLTECK